MKTKIVLEPGGTYSVKEFAESLKSAKGAKKKFVKENNEGWWSAFTQKYLLEKDFKNLMEIVKDENEERIFKYFNTMFNPFDIVIKEIGKDITKVESNNIYTIMAAPQITHYGGTFKIALGFNQPPITVWRRWSKDTTLSMQDIVNFM